LQPQELTVSKTYFFTEFKTSFKSDTEEKHQDYPINIGSTHISAFTMRTSTFLFHFSAVLALSASALSFQQQPVTTLRPAAPLARTQPFHQSSTTVNHRHSSGVAIRSAHFASETEIEVANGVSFPRMIRNKLRQATGFSFTVFRATLRGITGISLSAIYAGALAATGLWIRQAMSAVLSVFPTSFRYFLQPFLVMYYTPLILIRSFASPKNRKRALKKHETVLEAWKEAVVVAEQTEKDGYWPVVVSEDGYFELSKPPSVDGVVTAEAMAATVEHAMELNSEIDNNNESN
jgi:hypothetical protein